MLLQLKINNYLLIDQLELDFYAGLTVITGETGSGKSIIIDALMLVFGARANREIIRLEALRASFEATFNITNPLVTFWLQENDLLDLDNPDSLICRRVIDNQGKSKSQINGHTVTIAQIRFLGECLMDIHTQHASITLIKSDTQRKLLDEFAGISSQVVQLGSIYKAIQTVEDKLQLAQTIVRDLELKREILNEKVNQLADLKLVEGEWTNLTIEHKQLNNSQEVLSELDYASKVLNENNVSLIGGARDLNSCLSKISSYVPKVEGALRMLESIEIELKELSHEIDMIANSINQDPDRLMQVEERMDEIFSVSRKYRIEPERLTSALDEVQKELLQLDQDSDIGKLEEQLSKLHDEYNSIAKLVTESRKNACEKLGKQVTDLLHKMAIMGEFSIQLLPQAKMMSFGLENIEYQVSFNKGMPLQPLANTASGGELSRIALALYLLLSIHNPPEVIIFDEIDVGIGGKIASVIGQMLAKLGVNKQVICITHQPQAASCGKNHLVVSKLHDKDSTLTSVKYINHEERINEIARMLGGVHITDTTISHAKEMLDQHKI